MRSAIHLSWLKRACAASLLCRLAGSTQRDVTPVRPLPPERPAMGHLRVENRFPRFSFSRRVCQLPQRIVAKRRIAVEAAETGTLLAGDGALLDRADAQGQAFVRLEEGPGGVLDLFADGGTGGGFPAAMEGDGEAAGGVVGRVVQAVRL